MSFRSMPSGRPSSSWRRESWGRDAAAAGGGLWSPFFAPSSPICGPFIYCVLLTCLFCPALVFCPEVKVIFGRKIGIIPPPTRCRCGLLTPRARRIKFGVAAWVPKARSRQSPTLVGQGRISNSSRFPRPRVPEPCVFRRSSQVARELLPVAASASATWSAALGGVGSPFS